MIVASDTDVVGVERRSAGPSDRHPTERSLRKTASIGNTKILECEIEYPGGKWTEHIITWRKQSIEVPIFIQFNGYPPHIDPSYQGRVRLVEGASIELSDIRTSDQGWYECSIVFVDGTDDTTTNGTWIYLTVNCEY
ncbi:Ig-like domain-containing protein [Lamellibrachia satsuma]|nr:Ig-like domain-containing protein [Lamellibrachia satsuma]